MDDRAAMTLVWLRQSGRLLSHWPRPAQCHCELPPRGSRRCHRTDFPSWFFFPALPACSLLFSFFTPFSKNFFLSPLAFRPIGKGRELFSYFPSLFTESSQSEREKRAISAKISRKNCPQTEACGFKSSLAGKISLGSTSKNGQQKTPKPLKFRGFSGGYLFRIHNMVHGSGKDIPEFATE